MNRSTLILSLALLVGCGGLPGPVRDDVEHARQVFRAIVLAPDATQREQRLAQDAADTLTEIEYATGDLDELPADVRARLIARGAKAVGE